MASRRGFVVTLALLVVAAGVFALWPSLDLEVSSFFFRESGFVGRGGLWSAGRRFFQVAPFVLLAALAALYLCRRFAIAVPYAPSGRALVFLIATIVVAPVLVVNLGLKDHAHRPRPTQTQDFGGVYEFRPWDRFDGACKKNCSFVSGEASQGFWMVAPAMLAPPPWRALALGAALIFGATASLLRVAAGGHYLADVVLAALLTLAIVQGAGLLFFRNDEAS
jgi:membrane-associated phospholipid phosphatase